jgi:cysteine-rich repeat protein
VWLGVEECDAGDASSDVRPDTCRGDCRLAWCGDGVMDAGEQCDDGNMNSSTRPNFCRPNCVLPHCGDGVSDEGENCDRDAQEAMSEKVLPGKPVSGLSLPAQPTPAKAEASADANGEL